MSENKSYLSRFLSVAQSALALILFASLLINSALFALPVKAAGGVLKGGSGIVSDPYLIDDASDLLAVSNNVKNGVNNDKYYMLTASIDLSGISEWTPIGTDSKPFSGYFDGNGFSISGLKIGGGGAYKGLFGSSTGQIRNISLYTDGISGGDNTGGIAGKNTGTIENCTVSGSVSGSGCTGGIVGRNEGEIRNCRNDTGVNGTDQVGGIAGYSSGNVESCSNYSEVSGAKRVGGIVGKNDGWIINCVNGNYAKITTSDTQNNYTYAGGIAGEASNEIVRCTNKAEVAGFYDGTGGIVGVGDVVITECVNEGAVSTNGHDQAGGIIGAAKGGEIKNCTNRGAVSGASRTGGMTGTAANCQIENCINSGKITGNERTAGVVGEILAGANVDLCTNTGEISGAQYTGGIAGIQDYGGDVHNCINRGKVTGSGDQVGGITGRAVYDYFNGVGSSVIGSCTNTGEVTGVSLTGGIAGFSNANISNCLNKGNVTGVNYTAGIVGETFDGGETLTNDVNEGAVNGNERVGGITGRCRSCTIVRCHNKGSVNGKRDVGGIIGYMDYVHNPDSFVKKCINDGNVTGSWSSNEDMRIGGIVGFGQGVSISECGNNGRVTADGRVVGGIIGWVTTGGVIEDCYNRGVVYGEDYVGGIVARVRHDISVLRCYCYAPDNNGVVSGKDGVDCRATNTLTHDVRVGAIVGSRYRTDVTVTMEDNYWWYDCCDYAIGYIHIGGILSGKGYKDFFYQKYFKDTSNFKNWDFTNVWVIKDGAPVLRGAQNISPSGGVGGVGGTGGTGGTGEAVITNKYISNLAQFKAFRDEVNGGNTFEGMSIYLSCDLDLSGENWAPIGTNDHRFSGTFEGQDHIITGMNVDTSEYAGLFGYVWFGTINNLCIYGNVTSSAACVGGIAGFSNGSIRNCSFFGDVTGSASYCNVGGVCGGYGYYEGWGEIRTERDCDIRRENASHVSACKGTLYHYR
ncbi:MAG: hypothetical protein IKN38_06525 [Clostridia bacterium]|nr:hypothetical protein [Clostridia bacterium]